MKIIIDKEYSNAYQKMAALIAAKLSKEELVELAELLDRDAMHEFCTFIQEETCKVAPELYGERFEK